MKEIIGITEENQEGQVSKNNFLENLEEITLLLLRFYLRMLRKFSWADIHRSNLISSLGQSD